MDLLSGLGLLVTVIVLVVLGTVFSVLAGLMILLIPAGVLALSFTGSILFGGLVFFVFGVLAVLRRLY